MGCLTGVTGEPERCLHRPVRDTFFNLFGHLSSPVMGSVDLLASLALHV